MDINLIKSMVESKTYLDFYHKEEDSIEFTTRKNGNVQDGEYGEEDIDEVNKAIKFLKNKFKDIECSIDTCDEWVNLYVKSK